MTTLVKIGGNSLRQVETLPDEDVVIVHGGGAQIDLWLGRLDIKPRKIDGRRVTDPVSMDIVNMVLSADVNSRIVNSLNQRGVRAVGINGMSDAMMKAELLDEGKYGQVGRIKEVRVDVISLFVENGMVPVISPVGIDENFKPCNINADDCACELAKALNVERLILLCDVIGVLKDGELIPELGIDQVGALIKTGVIQGGMIPKVQAAVECVRGGIPSVLIGSDIRNGTVVTDILTRFLP